MHVDLLSTTKGSPKVIHGTENGKKTACGISLVKPENIGMYTNAGQMNDVVQLTCEKCKTVIAKRMIREANKEFAAQLKEEQRQLKRERASSKHHTEAPAPAPVQSGSGSSEYIPPSMRKPTPPMPQRTVDTTAPIPLAPSPMPSSASPASNDVLAQFAVPSVPTSLPGMTPPSVPSAPSVPVASSVDDVLAQFAVPSVPTSLPGMTPPPAPSVPTASSADDVLAQFAVPSVPTSLPGMTPPPAPSVPTASSADDVLAQFAVPSVPTSLPGMTPPPAPSVPTASSADDVLAQFAVPSVPTSLPGMTPPPAPSVPTVSSADDVLAQFAVPSVPTSLPGMTPPPAPSVPTASSVEDVLAQFTVPSAPAVQKSGTVSGSSVNQDDILAQFAFKQPTVRPYADDDMIATAPVEQADESALLDDLLLMPNNQSQIDSIDSLPDIANVPSSIPSIPVAGMQQDAIPALNVPQAPPAPPVPEMPVPPVQQQFAVPSMPQNAPQAPAQSTYQTQQFNPFAVPAAPKVSNPGTPMPLFVGYSADGRQLFQTYDELGNPIPINEPVYSTPPEQVGNNIAVKVAAMASNAAKGGTAPILDMDQIMASMGIADPAKPKKEEGKAINFTEYKIPEEKKRKKPVSKPASAIAAPVQDGPVSAAEAKRRKKVDKINKEFEKQLRQRGIDPRTGGIMIDPRK